MKDHIYASRQEIAKVHGLFVFIGYCLCRFLVSFTLTRILFRLPRCFKARLAFAYDSEHDKANPLWHDAVILFMSFVTAYLVWAGFSTKVSPRGIVWWLACWYLILDMILYHSGVLWFDDLEVGAPVAHRKVWSHRRILFQAIINFVETVALYSALYRQYMLTSADLRFTRFIHYSFAVSTALSRPDGLSGPPNWLVDSQVAVSVFFLLVVISIVASVGYRRPEIAPSLENGYKGGLTRRSRRPAPRKYISGHGRLSVTLCKPRNLLRHLVLILK